MTSTISQRSPAPDQPRGGQPCQRRPAPLAVLDMLRYCTSQRALPFCDHKPPTAQDTAWNALYARLTRP
ncbi:hypothetical protein SAMN05216499_11949 [Actinacidiphila paucisporea]|uniref:Uncharacterized protein n=1 Tax=Actinacidiphila paucisporea TaxID=310782 RepID=A0A1M7NMJ3_9ACTN|nr:hypothetical protein SAMN05216499_11949 [Actinacidiphila paucisporea]